MRARNLILIVLAFAIALAGILLVSTASPETSDPEAKTNQLAEDEGEDLRPIYYTEEEGIRPEEEGVPGYLIEDPTEEGFSD